MAIRPPQLQSGDTVGIVTLGSPMGADRINEGIAALQRRGFKVIVGDYVYSASGYPGSDTPAKGVGFNENVSE